MSICGAQWGEWPRSPPAGEDQTQNLAPLGIGHLLRWGRGEYLWHIHDPFTAHQVYQLECSSLEDSMTKAKGIAEMEL